LQFCAAPGAESESTEQGHSGRDIPCT
jgi:hypothetical protein